MTATTKYNEIRDRITKLRDDASKQMREAFNEGCRELFIQNPTLRAFGWTQYTPYFNDGDNCEFGVHSDYPSLLFADDDATDDEFRDDNLYDFGPDRDDPAAMQMKKAVAEFLQAFGEEDMKTIFGDHAKVLVFRDAPEPETLEYDHD